MWLEQGAGEGRHESVVNELKAAAPAQGQLRLARRNGRGARGLRRNGARETCPALFFGGICLVVPAEERRINRGADCTAKVAAPGWYIRQNDDVKDDGISWRMERGGAACFGRGWRWALGHGSHLGWLGKHIPYT